MRAPYGDERAATAARSSLRDGRDGDVTLDHLKDVGLCA
jgi:hypothetical protein